MDNLAMAYGITGNLTASEQVLNYGLSKDPAYPMFYFILADGSAERGDFESTMKYLRRALSFRTNMIPGEQLPDPMMDDSFKAFRNNEDFQRLAAEFRAAPTSGTSSTENFSRSYVMTGAKGGLKFKKGMSRSLFVSQTESAIVVARAIDGVQTRNQFPLDGSSGPYRSSGGVPGQCTGHLKGKSLVLETQVVARPQPSGPSIQIHTTEKWQLSSDMKTLTIRTDVDFPNSPLRGFQLEEPWSEIYTRQ